MADARAGASDGGPAAFLFDGPAEAPATVLLGHGAGAPMDSPAMTALAQALASAGLEVVRFEFDYMARRRSGGRRSLPPRAEALVPEHLAAVEALGPRRRLIVGGKSMGGRVASLSADALHAEGRAAGLLCFGYPFHPRGRPGRLRTAHLEALKIPTLICQGERDPLGSVEEAAGYALSETIEILWLRDGDHDLKPRRSVTGLTLADHLATAAEAAAAWAARLDPPA